ncbi:MAG: hypothetical protein ABIR47_17830 [Candidatus Kapaibacterium sp.]
MSISFARLVAGAAMIFFVALPTSPLRAQERDTVQEKKDLSWSLSELGRSLDDLRWASVDVYRVDDELAKRLMAPLESPYPCDHTHGAVHMDPPVYCDSLELLLLSNQIIPEGWNGDVFNGILRIIRSPDAAPDLLHFKTAVASLLGIAPEDIEDRDAEPLFQVATRIVHRYNSNPRIYYLICTRDRENPGLIALLGGDENDGEFILKGHPLAGIDLYNYLQTFDPTLYSDLKKAVVSRSLSLYSR